MTIDKSFSLNTFNKGDLLTLLCALFFACHITSIGYFSKDKEPIVLSIIQFAVTAILFTISALLFEPFPIHVQASVLKAVVYLSLACTVFAYTVQNVAQKYTSSSHAAIILCLEAIFGTILAIILLGEILTLKMLIGCIIIFLGIFITETKLDFMKKKKQNEKK
ncbi:DMT family transporter [Crassaminicella thermophila]|uniref:DMT family transporter n=1 Tax=Crassaminicella thermophila TaxID=2599308 RepID=UPI001E523A82|nr:DMT family transporter [Crassaminicella thermophila]